MKKNYMKKLFLILLTFSSLLTYAQGIVVRSAPVSATTSASNYNKQQITDANLYVTLTFGVPTGLAFSLNNANPQKGYLFYNTSTNKLGVYNGTTWDVLGAGGAIWGAITGNLNDQTDLTTALNARQYISNLSSDLTPSAIKYPSVNAVINALALKQDLLVSGTNIKTINGSSLLGSGNITISSAPAGSNTQVQFNNSGSFGASSKLTYDQTTGTLNLNGSGVDGSSGQINFTQGYNRAALMLFDGGSNSRYGWGLRPSQMQFFMPSETDANMGGFTWNKGGEFQPSGVNELMKLTTENGRLGIGVSVPSEKLDVNGNINIQGTPSLSNHAVRKVDLDNGLALKQNNVTLTTTGSGAATFNQSTGALNIPTPVGTTFSNPTATAGTSVINGSSTSAMRSDAAPKVDSTATGFRTVANSYSLAQTKSLLDLKANLAGNNVFTGAQTFNGGNIMQINPSTGTYPYAQFYNSAFVIQTSASTFVGLGTDKVVYQNNGFGMNLTSANLTGNRGVTLPDNTGQAALIQNSLTADATNTLSPTVTAVNTALSLKESTANKQNSLAIDGTGIKFPTVDAINSLSDGGTGKSSVIVATTANITLSGTQTIDGVAVTAGQRVLVKNQTTTSQNGIYIVNASTWTRSTDMDAVAEFQGATVFVQQGTVGLATIWINTTPMVTVGTTAVTFATVYTAGTNITVTGKTIALATNPAIGAATATTAANQTSSTAVATTAYAQTASLPVTLSTKTAAYTVTLADFGNSNILTVPVDCTTASFTITLPVYSTILGKIINIKRINAGANTVTVSGNGNNIDGASTLVISMQWANAQIQAIAGLTQYITL